MRSISRALLFSDRLATKDDDQDTAQLSKLTPSRATMETFEITEQIPILGRSCGPKVGSVERNDTAHQSGDLARRPVHSATRQGPEALRLNLLPTLRRHFEQLLAEAHTTMVRGLPVHLILNFIFDGDKSDDASQSRELCGFTDG